MASPRHPSASIPLRFLSGSGSNFSASPRPVCSLTDGALRCPRATRSRVTAARIDKGGRQVFVASLPVMCGQ